MVIFAVDSAYVQKMVPIGYPSLFPRTFPARGEFTVSVDGAGGGVVAVVPPVADLVVPDPDEPVPPVLPEPVCPLPVVPFSEPS
jgi:hypothetical protein